MTILRPLDRAYKRILSSKTDTLKHFAPLIDGDDCGRLIVFEVVKPIAVILLVIIRVVA